VQRMCNSPVPSSSRTAETPRDTSCSPVVVTVTLERMRRWTLAGGTIALILLAAGLTGCSATSVAPQPASASGTAAVREGTATPVQSSQAADGGTGVAGPPSVSPSPLSGAAASALASLEVKGRAPKSGYSRAQFGQAWADVDRNGCDTRNDILARDLQNVVVKPGTHNCVVLTGDYVEPYTGEHVFFQRGSSTSSAVEIDHVVALGNAWQTGAQLMEAGSRLRYANDPLVLLAVDGPANQQKGDGDAATWLPANKSFRCLYVARQVAIKAKYHLWLTPPEKDAMVRVLGACPEQQLPS